MFKLKIHASEVHSIVTGYKANLKQYPPLSKGAKSLVRSKVLMHLRQYDMQFSTSATVKGQLQEQAAIDFMNSFRGKEYKKNDTRIESGILTGECDILDTNDYAGYYRKIIRDVKCPEKWTNMPATWEEVRDYAKKGGYDWQGVAYMYLYDADIFRIDCIFMPTEFDDIPHWANHTQYMISPTVDDKQRICTWGFDRDYHKEYYLLDRLEKCNQYAQYYYNRVK